MAMTDIITPNPSGSEYRVVTVADLRHELQRERLITDAHFEKVSHQMKGLDDRFSDFKQDTIRRFEEASANVDRRFEQVDTRFDEMKDNVDKRFEQVDKRFEQVDQRFDQVDKRFDKIDQRFDALDERLRFNKTLIVASISAVASAASVVVSLLR